MKQQSAFSLAKFCDVFFTVCQLNKAIGLHQKFSLLASNSNLQDLVVMSTIQQQAFCLVREGPSLSGHETRRTLSKSKRTLMNMINILYDMIENCLFTQWFLIQHQPVLRPQNGKRETDILDAYFFYHIRMLSTKLFSAGVGIA